MQGLDSDAMRCDPGMCTRERLLLDHVDTPIGRLALVADGDGRLRARASPELALEPCRPEIDARFDEPA